MACQVVLACEPTLHGRISLYTHYSYSCDRCSAFPSSNTNTWRLLPWVHVSDWGMELGTRVRRGAGAAALLFPINVHDHRDAFLPVREKRCRARWASRARRRCAAAWRSTRARWRPKCTCCGTCVTRTSCRWDTHTCHTRWDTCAAAPAAREHRAGTAHTCYNLGLFGSVWLIYMCMSTI